MLLPHLASPYKGEELSHTFIPLTSSPLPIPHYIFPANVGAYPVIFAA